jgi:Predicted dithiol-disulfide isomerase involved in polyketide biosynthesis
MSTTASDAEAPVPSSPVPTVFITYYFEVYSSWCYWAEPAWAELKRRYAGRVAFDWRIALMRPEDFPASPGHCDWFYQRSGTVVRSPFMLNSGWVQPDRAAYVTPDLVVEAARDFLPPGDERVRLALGHAAMREGKRVDILDTAVEIAARASEIPADKLRAAAVSDAVRARVEASTAEFFAHKLSQRPAFILGNDIGDKVVFSGVWRLEPLAAALDSLLADGAAYASYHAHHGTAPAA